MSIHVGKTGRIRLEGDNLGALRHSVWKRSKGKCEECGMRLVEQSGLWRSMHLSHTKALGAGGDDTEANTKALCLDCHMIQIHNPRCIRAKV